MGKIEVTISEMQSAANTLKQQIQEFLTLAGNVKTSSDALGDTWEGDSHTAFEEEQTKMNTWYKQMVDVAETYVSYLGTTAQKYQETDASGASTVRG